MKRWGTNNNKKQPGGPHPLLPTALPLIHIPGAEIPFSQPIKVIICMFILYVCLYQQSTSENKTWKNDQEKFVHRLPLSLLGVELQPSEQWCRRERWGGGSAEHLWCKVGHRAEIDRMRMLLWVIMFSTGIFFKGWRTTRNYLHFTMVKFGESSNTINFSSSKFAGLTPKWIFLIEYCWASTA